jgi:archaemetzincin
MRRLVLVVGLAGVGAAATPSVAAATPSVCVVPLGHHDRKILPVVERGIEYLYGLEVRTLEARPLPRSAWYEPRQRYRAEKILAYLDASIRPGSGCDIVMGFTAADISTTKDTHADWGMLGLAWIGGDAGVMSTYRLGRRVSRRAETTRAVKVMNHELGHALGLPHIAVPGCLMHDLGGTVKTVDLASGLLCREAVQGIERRDRFALPEHAQFDWRAVLGR